MWNKLLAAVFVLIAFILAVLAIVLEPGQMKAIIIISRFFEVMLPVLGVGALLRYLTHCPHAHLWNTILSACTLFIAVVIGILAVTLSSNNIEIVVMISRFFEVMLPILGVAALVKLMTTCSKKECCEKKDAA